MRKIIMLRPKAHELSEDDIKKKVAHVVSLFDAYLDEYPIKNARSKHALMGPVAKILDRAKTGQWDVESLTGYALRVHEMNPQSRGGFISATAIGNLRLGTETLLDLCTSIPVTSLATTIEQIDYSLYFQRRKQGIEWLEKQSISLRNFLQEKYVTDEAFRQEWGLTKKDMLKIDTIRYFGTSNSRYRNGNDRLKADMNAFYEKMREQNQNPEAIAEEEEHEL